MHHHVSRVLLAAIAAAFLLVGSLSGQSPLARLLVYKNPTPDRPVGSPTPPFSPVVSARPAAAGFAVVADYTSRMLYEGPATVAPGLVQDLVAEGYHAEIATELDTVIFNDFWINADTGVSVPPIPPSTGQPSGADGLYVIALRGYPTAAWIDDLTSRNVRLVEALPAAGYLVRGNHGLMARLKGEVGYVRGVFSVTPPMKKVLFTSSVPPASPFRKVFLQTAEVVPAESLKGYLQSLDPEVVEERHLGKASYWVKLSDLDIENLTHFRLVYAISPISEPELASERQGVLALQPVFNGGRQEVAATSPNYYQLLQSRGVIDPSAPGYQFSNTRIAVIDSGLDNGVMAGANVHPDFISAGQLDCTDPLAANCQDLHTHGTVAASIIAGYADFGERWAGYRADNGQYRYGLGLAPKCRLIIERNRGCFFEQFLDDIFNTGVLQARAPNVINYSQNSPSEEGYDAESQQLDRRTRLHDWLFTVSAGNNTDADLTPFVRAPATAKNILAVVRPRTSLSAGRWERRRGLQSVTGAGIRLGDHRRGTSPPKTLATSPPFRGSIGARPSRGSQTLSLRGSGSPDPSRGTPGVAGLSCATRTSTSFLWAQA